MLLSHITAAREVDGCQVNHYDIMSDIKHEIHIYTSWLLAS